MPSKKTNNELALWINEQIEESRAAATRVTSFSQLPINQQAFVLLANQYDKQVTEVNRLTNENMRLAVEAAQCRGDLPSTDVHVRYAYLAQLFTEGGLLLRTAPIGGLFGTLDDLLDAALPQKEPVNV